MVGFQLEAAKDFILCHVIELTVLLFTSEKRFLCQKDVDVKPGIVTKVKNVNTCATKRKEKECMYKSKHAIRYKGNSIKKKSIHFY